MRIEHLFSLAVSILAGLLISGSVRAGAPAGAAIEGVVVRADTGQPVAGARVVLASMKRWQDGGTFGPWRPHPGSDEPAREGFALPSPDIATGWTVTDGNGHFAMTGLVPDSYSLAAQADGFVIRFYGQKALRTTGTPLTLTEGQSLAGIRFPLVGTGTLSGNISEGSDPAAGVWVRLLRDSFDGHGRRQTIHVGQAVTDDRGRYRFFWIPPGRYHLATGGPNFSDEPEDRPLRFYPEAFEPADAARFEIHSGEARTLDWNLPPLQRFHLRGRVIDSRTGKVPAAPSISLALRTSVQWMELERHGSDIRYDSNTGQFEADELNPGVYQVRCESDGWQEASTIVRITNVDVEGVVLDVAENADSHFAPLQGKITVRGDSRLAFDKLKVEFFSVTRPPIVPHSPNYDVDEEVESDGTFEVDINSDRSSDQDLVDGEGNLSGCSEAEIQAISLALKHKDQLAALLDSANQPPSARAAAEETGPPPDFIQGPSVGAIAVLRGIAEDLGIAGALGDEREGRLALWQVLARALDQGSRLSAVRLARDHGAAAALGLPSFDEDDLYANLAWIQQRQQSIEQHLFEHRSAAAARPSLYLYDVTSTYLEGEHNALAAFGYNRDGKRGKKQIVIGLLCDEDGVPVEIAGVLQVLLQPRPDVQELITLAKVTMPARLPGSTAKVATNKKLPKHRPARVK